MKQVVQNYRSGELTVIDVPTPATSPGGVLVASLYSLISTGTELMKVTESKMSLLGKARARPDQVRKLVDTARQQGVVNAYGKAMGRLDSYTPLGYSLVGVVLEVGGGAEEFSRGQLVACAGNEFALHADVNWVPRNLCVPVPGGVDPKAAAFTTVASIALQGVRQGDVQLGGTACVVGLGLIGQVVVRLLVAAGVRVVGVDPVTSRCSLAEAGGALVCATPDDEGVGRVEAALAAASGGLGADQVFLTAGGTSNGPVELAARVARDRGSVIDIGKCSLDLPWNSYYEKELDVRFSRSYGPGRYDASYELDGVDYPAGYVRWTERRNMSCVLDLMSVGSLDIGQLVSGTFPVDEAPSVYRRLAAGELDGIGFLLTYPDAPEAAGAAGRTAALSRPKQPVGPPARPMASRPLPGAPVRVGFIGAGSYASSMLIPRLRERDDVVLASVATRSSLSAINAQRKFGFAAAGTDVDAVLEDPSVDLVFVVTRHSSHADLVCRALSAGKAVFVEKPLCISREELDEIEKTVANTGNDRVMVGFNRRFAPMFVEMRERFGPSRGPGFARYLVNAGTVAATSWYGRQELEGSRFVGEGGHFLDTLAWWFGAAPVEVLATPGGEAPDVNVSVRFSDGSLGVVSYLTTGHPRYQKETFEVTGGGRSGRLDNFKRATVWSGARRRTSRSLGGVDKGQRAEINAVLRATGVGGAMPITFGSLALTTRATLAVAVSAATGGPVRV